MNKIKSNAARLIAALITFSVVPTLLFSQTTILKWKDGKEACVTITYDDGSKNQFELAIPIMDRLGIPGTFFINTMSIKGSEHLPSFVGQPLMQIIKESEASPTSLENVFERSSLIRYLGEIQGIEELKDVDMYSIGSRLERKQYETVFSEIENILLKLRESGKIYQVEATKAQKNLHTGWDDLRKYAARGHEIANHTISHPHLSTLDEANILYETEKCKADIEKNLGFSQTLTIEGPYGIHDDRVMEVLYPNYPFLRNRVPERYFDEILRSDSRLPEKSEKEYIHWQRGPLSKTTFDQMISWVETSVENEVWLVLVFHGIEGIGWEAIPAKTIDQYFTYMKSREKEIWFATYQDAYKYIRQRMNSTIKQSSDEKSIEIEVQCDLDKNIYNQPLTLQTKVPANWKSVQIQQSGRTEILTPFIKNGDHFVRYNALPEKGRIILTSSK